ncbi:MAG: M23 family metallopeptidase [Micromonosporaceae bacterium]
MTTTLKTWASTRLVILFAALAMLASGVAVAAAPSPALAAYGAMHWPTSGTVTSLFNWRCSGYADNHAGIDIANAKTTPIKAAYRGKVVFAGWSSGYGKLVILDHSDGYRTYYAHLYSIRYNVGRRVSRGERIGRMGESGHATGPHLHFEIRRYGDPKNKFGEYRCGQWVSAGNNIRARFDGLPA